MLCCTCVSKLTCTCISPLRSPSICFSLTFPKSNPSLQSAELESLYAVPVENKHNQEYVSHIILQWRHQTMKVLFLTTLLSRLTVMLSEREPSSFQCCNIDTLNVCTLDSFTSVCVWGLDNIHFCVYCTCTMYMYVCLLTVWWASSVFLT